MRRHALAVLQRAQLHTSQRAVNMESTARTPIPLDPALRDFLSQNELPVHAGPRTRRKTYIGLNPTTVREADFELAPKPQGPEDLLEEHETMSSKESREKRSPEASFGSQRIGMVSLPWQLEKSVSTIIQRKYASQSHF
jgi:hypothetical protein